MQSSGGGGYGDPATRDPAAVADDLADGYVTAAGRAAYREALPVQARATPGLVPRHCRLPAALATLLGAVAGDLVELSSPSGPALRLWVTTVDPALPDSVVAAAFDGAFRIRRLGGGRP